MAIPVFEEFIKPVLVEIGKSPTPISSVRKVLIPVIASRFGLSDADLAERLSSGQGRVANRVAWSVSYLKKAGLIDQPVRGAAIITDDGRAFLKEHRGSRVGADDLMRFPGFAEFAGATGAPRKDKATSLEVLAGPESPEERIQTAIAEIKAKVADELFSALEAIDPTDFEHLVLDLMKGLGYGGRQGQITRTGGSGDFGIDGIIRSDRIGLEKIYLQAKRWQAAVGRKEIQAFFGSLAGLRATKGVFITTIRFTEEALAYAENVSSTLILIDGDKLAELMIEAEVGVRKKEPMFIPEFDSDYFD